MRHSVRPAGLILLLLFGSCSDDVPKQDADPALQGKRDDLARDAIPDVPYVYEASGFAADHPDLPGIGISFDTLVVVIDAKATVGGLNDLLGGIGGKVVGGLPSQGDVPGILVVRTPSTNHAQMERDLATLLASDQVRYAVSDIELSGTIVPKPNGGTPANWSWQVSPGGANWGIEAVRMPQVWNLNTAARAQGGSSVVSVIDVGFDLPGHPDLSDAVLMPPERSHKHGTHVAGTIGASWNNGVGVDGVSPFAKMSLVSIRTMAEAIDRLGRSGNAQVVNTSIGYNWKSNTGMASSIHEEPKRRAREDGKIVLEVLKLLQAAGNLPILVAAAGNDSGGVYGTQEATWASPFCNAALELDAANIIVVEAVDASAARASFSNTKGHVSAPGVGIVSAALAGGYQPLQGTSMAAPHVSGIVSYFRTLFPEFPKPTLQQNPIRDALVETASATTGDAAKMVDAWATFVRIRQPDILRMLSDLDDGTADGNDRTVDQDEPDGVVDMSDFRRLRDALLQIEEAAGLSLDGAATHAKRNLNGDGLIEAAAKENVYPRGDLNGDGVLSRDATAKVGTLGQLTDLQVMQDVFDDPHVDANALPALLDSGDVHLDVSACFAHPEASKVVASFRKAGSGTESYGQEIRRSDPNPVITLAVNSGGYELELKAYDNSGALVAQGTDSWNGALGSDTTSTPDCDKEAPPPNTIPGAWSFIEAQSITAAGCQKLVGGTHWLRAWFFPNGQWAGESSGTGLPLGAPAGSYMGHVDGTWTVSGNTLTLTSCPSDYGETISFTGTWDKTTGELSGTFAKTVWDSIGGKSGLINVVAPSPVCADKDTEFSPSAANRCVITECDPARRLLRGCETWDANGVRQLYPAAQCYESKLYMCWDVNGNPL